MEVDLNQTNDSLSAEEYTDLILRFTGENQIDRVIQIGEIARSYNELSDIGYANLISAYSFLNQNEQAC